MRRDKMFGKHARSIAVGINLGSALVEDGLMRSDEVLQMHRRLPTRTMFAAACWDWNMPGEAPLGSPEKGRLTFPTGRIKIGRMGGKASLRKDLYP